MDVDEEALREDRVAARLYGSARVRASRACVQRPEGGIAAAATAALEALCRRARGRRSAPGRLYLLGPGTTTAARARARSASRARCSASTRSSDGRLAGRDLSEARLLELLDGGPRAIVISARRRPGRRSSGAATSS